MADASEVSDMPILQSSLQSTDQYCVSPLANLVMVVYLRRLCLHHLHTSLHDPLYSFWDNHYQLEKLISRRENDLIVDQSRVNGGDVSREPLCLLSSINLAAIEMSLAEAVMAKLDSEIFRNTTSAEARASCDSAFSRVVEFVRAGMNHAETRATFKQSSALFAWALVTIIQTTMRMVLHGGNQSVYTNGLRLLSGVVRELVSPMFIPPGLLEQVDMKLDENERPPNRYLL